MTNYLQLAFSPGMPEILLVLAVILIFFGAKKLPELAKGMGQGIKEFKKATRDVNNELERAMDDHQLMDQIVASAAQGDPLPVVR